MRKKTLFRELFINFLVVVVAAIILTALYATFSFRDFYFRETEADLEQRARIVEPQVRDILASTESEQKELMRKMEPLCKDLGGRGEFRLTVILPSGLVIGDSDEKAEIMENHRTRPEVIQALNSGLGVNIRYSHTLQRRMMYVAVPLWGGAEALAVVRVSLSVSKVDRALETLWLTLLFGGIVFILLAALLIYFRSRTISHPLLELARRAESISRGNFDEKLEVNASFEITRLAGAMNHMSRQLKQRIQTVTRQRAQAHAMLSSMIEGVIAVDMEKRIISMNKAALDLFHLEKAAAAGERIEEYVSISEILQIIDDAGCTLWPRPCRAAKILPLGCCWCCVILPG
ncbi:MAG: HAMP domain-containing protein [Spirochaetia bacterium]